MGKCEGAGADLSKFKDECEKFGFSWEQIRNKNLENGSTNDSEADHNCSNTHLGEKKLNHLPDTVLEHFHFVLTRVRGSL